MEHDMKHGILAVGVLAAGAWCAAADWPRWRGPSGTGHVPAGAKTPTSLPERAAVVWRKEIGLGAGSPVVGSFAPAGNAATKDTATARTVKTEG